MTTRREYQPGETIPGTIYQVVHVLGAGGMGTVYDVEDTSIGKRYVVKTLHSELGDRKDLARRMQAEARTLARLHHPNIVEVITAGVTQDDRKLPYYVMEKLNGQSLRLVLDKKGSIDLPHAVHVAIDLLDALDHAHDKGVIHRDVKPENIFLHRTMSGVTVTKLLDFGVMALLDSGRNETGGRFLGTLRYAAPEQLRGEKATPKIDLYAAGLVIYEIIAGRGPFDDEGESKQIMAARLSKVPPLLSTRAPVKIPPELDALLKAALSRDPDARPKDAFSFSAALRNLKRTTGVTPTGVDSTENRATQAALLGMSQLESARPAVVVLNPSPAAPTQRQSQPPTQPEPARPAAKTTMLGMPAPSMSGATLENAVLSNAHVQPSGPAPQPVAVVQTPAVDRSAETRNMLVDTPRGPRHGTEPVIMPPVAPTLVENPGAPPVVHAPVSAPAPVTLPVAQGFVPQAAGFRPPSVHPAAPSSVAPAAHFQWPVERGNERSESAQVHSMTAGAVRPPPRKGVAIAILAAAITLGAAAAGIYFLTCRGGGSDGAAPGSQATAAETKDYTPKPLVEFPAPTIPVPAYPSASAELPASEPASASPAPSAPATTSASSAAAPANYPPPRGTAHAPPRVPVPPLPKQAPPPPAKTEDLHVGPGKLD